MDGESRKRKMENDEEEEDDEEKIQKFFALLRSTRDVHNRIMSGVVKPIEGGERKDEEEKKPVEVWNPSFQPEDFMDGAHHQSDKGSQASLAGSSKREDETKEDNKGGNDGLDLKLSL